MSERVPPKLEEWSKRFAQDGDCCDGEPQDLHVDQLDGGGGPFWIIKTERWAFDSIEELVKVLREAGVAETAEKVST